MERKRHLPLWMLGVTAADQSKKSGNGDGNDNLKEELSLKDCQPEKKSRAKKGLRKESLDFDSSLLAKCETKKIKRKSSHQTVDMDDKESSDLDSTLLAKCEAKKIRRKSSHQTVDMDDAIHIGGGIGKRKAKCKGDGTVLEPASKMHEAKSCGLGSHKKISNRSQKEEDEELTMEDLMSIAEEYVKAGDDMGDQELLIDKSESNSQLPATYLYRDQLGDSLEATQSEWRFPANIMAESPSNSTETGWKEQERLASEGNVVSSRKIGDPAKDMLDVLLGPLLKTTKNEEKKLASVTEDMGLAYELRAQTQKDDVGKEMVTLTKKKSSLRDKVAVFFD